MPAPDQKRIIGACIFAAVGSKKPDAVAVVSDDTDSDSETEVVDPLWKDLTDEEQGVYIEVAGFLHSFAGPNALSQFDTATASEAVWNKFDVSWAATAVHVFKNVAQEFGHL